MRIKQSIFPVPREPAFQTVRLAFMTPFFLALRPLSRPAEDGRSATGWRPRRVLGRLRRPGVFQRWIIPAAWAALSKPVSAGLLLATVAEVRKSRRVGPVGADKDGLS